ncbi:MAG TPA: carbonic anhydrase [Acidimicrobiia bacterium]|nr:carbonic anhydrase [Acidimicrobiia bacterium]
MPELRAIPRKHLAIITCMDARIDPQRALGLELGDAHVLRNAGAVVSDDMLRSLVLSQRLLETRSVAVMAHTECGLRDVHDDELARQLERETGSAPPFAFGAFHDLDEHVRGEVGRVRACPWLAHVDDVRGYVLDVSDGTVRTVV